MENKNLYELEGKTAVVTGSSRGIGKAIALKLSSLGANIVLNYRNSLSSIEETIKIIETRGGKVIAVQGDVSDFDDAENIIKTAVEKFGSLDILVNNAGITMDGVLIRMKEEQFDKVIQVNLKGTFNCMKHASRIMLKQRQGKIINLSSVVGITGNAGQANYAAAKAGIIGITKSAAKELGGRGINVNAVAPGFIKTDMTEVLSDKVKQSALDSIPLKRLGTPEDVANIVSFLASDKASYITGQVIHIDGGMVI